MTRFLLKPLVYLLVFGLLGCTSTKWTALEPQAAQGPSKLLRVTLTDGERIELRDALVTEESVSGMKGYRSANNRGLPFTVPLDQVQSIEYGDLKTSAGETVGLIIGVILGARVLAGIVFAAGYQAS